MRVEFLEFLVIMFNVSEFFECMFQMMNNEL